MSSDHDGEPPGGPLPDDYEECGYCGFDHSYDYDHALAWHMENDPENKLYE